MTAHIRQAATDDAAGIVEIYRPIVENTAVSFEVAVPSVADIASRIESILASHQWLVAEVEGDIAGYAYASPHRAREAYRYATEVSAYVHPDHQQRGLARDLYTALFEAVRELGYHGAYAAITLPNEASIALHQSCGFTEIGTFHEVGYKFDAWHDVSWWQRRI